jgi:hypothetical protein
LTTPLAGAALAGAALAGTLGLSPSAGWVKSRTASGAARYAAEKILRIPRIFIE